MERETIAADLAVVGAGAAGLWTALVAANAGADVALVSRSPLAETASYWAQGGLAAALDADDSPGLHADDTLRAGRGACRESAVRVLCEEAPARIRDLRGVGVGVGFDLDADGELALGLEGGHSRRRIVHAGGSSTGRRVTRELSARAANHPRIRVLEGIAACGLLVDAERCVGVVTEPVAVAAKATVLATGGAAALWSRTTNPPGATGLGISIAHAAGAVVADLELVQFHPTALSLANGAANTRYDGFLISEAVRGEGAPLIGADGERFVDELAPRDEVARAILERCRIDKRASVMLDMRQVDHGRFPNIVTALRNVGFDPGKDLIPVSPAAHYVMGGIATDLDGRTSLRGLYAVGECACTGLHGANRLASNSLSECFVFGHRAAIQAAAAEGGTRDALTRATARVLSGPMKPPAATREALWRNAGLERGAEGLASLLKDEFPLAQLIARSALAREESRGVHLRTDFPEREPDLDDRHFVIQDHKVEVEEWN